ncbi:peptide deformylase [Kineococcus sp. R86509]|uniref:peptide deformylase n=1 Tax=Kineococcus sp. R86509 TaxID=3093851 RepID=UPI0036D21734
MTIEGEDEFTRCMQHEVDHLDGRLFLDRLAGPRRRDALRQLRTATSLHHLPAAP